MAQLSQGLKYYLLILVTNLVDDLTAQGLKKAVNNPLLQEHDVDRAFFVVRAIQRRLPVHPDQAEPDLWLDIVDAVRVIRRVLDVLEKSTFERVAREARRTTSQAARTEIKQALEQRRIDGNVDFRLHGLSTTTAMADEPDPAALESSRLKRKSRYHALNHYPHQTLNEQERAILLDAKSFAGRVIENDVEDPRIDALLAMGTALMELASVRANTGVPEAIREKFDRMAGKAAMALGSIVYRQEYQQLLGQLRMQS